MAIRSLFVNSTENESSQEFIASRSPIRRSGIEEAEKFSECISGNHIYLEKGKGRPIIFCPGLYGSVENIAKIGLLLSYQYRFIIPYLPMYDLPLNKCTIPNLALYIQNFMEDIGLREAVFIGSSMGGGASLSYSLLKEHRSKALILCGSSGLSSMPMQKGFFKRKNYEFVKKSTQNVFYDPNTPSEIMIKEVFNSIQKYEIVLRSIRFTKSTAKQQLHDDLKNINIPCQLIWGQQDSITPPETGQLFKQLLPKAELHYIDKCGHVPTQEHPDQVLSLIKKFLVKINYI